MHIKYPNKQMDVQKAWLYSLNRYYAYKVSKQIDGCTKSLAIFTKPLLCIYRIQTNRWMYRKLGYGHCTVTMHIKYTNKQIDVQKAWQYSINRYYAYKVYNQVDGCTKGLAIFIKPLLCI